MSDLHIFQKRNKFLPISALTLRADVFVIFLEDMKIRPFVFEILTECYLLQRNIQKETEITFTDFFGSYEIPVLDKLKVSSIL